jgi:GDPmannose 4,6-dehydratase
VSAVPTALLTGIAGQDGSYLAELLLSKGYRVVGVTRQSSAASLARIRHLVDRVELVAADLLDQQSLVDVVRRCRPREIYNLAAQSVAHRSWEQPVLTGESSALGVTRVLEAMRHEAPEARFYQASSSEVFGLPAESPQRETTPLRPRTPYGAAKAYGHWITVTYREALGHYAVSGILYNHESPRRGLEFVTRKVSDGVARIALGLQRALRLGDLEARRDWGFAGDYVEAMWLALQRDVPRDYVVGTGRAWSVRELCELAFGVVGLDYRDFVVRDDKFLRPAEAEPLVADATRAREELGWRPRVTFPQLVAMMVEADLDRYRATR